MALLQGGSSAAAAALARGLYAPFIFAGCAVTLASCAVVAASYWRLEELRRHPAHLVLLRCGFDAVLAVSLALETALRVGVGGDGAAAGAAPAALSCAGFAFIAQFSLLGSEL